MSTLSVEVRHALPGFSLELAHDFALEGITALFGPSGAGKSTLLRILAGFEREARAQVRHDGEVWQDERTFLPPHRRGVGYMFQDGRLFPHLDVAGNLRYAERRSKARPGPRFGDVVDALGLAPLLDRRTGMLSGGERQRVALGRTLLARPRLLLADEPLTALDARRKAEILPLLAELPVRFGVPVIHVTHALDEVVRLADRMVVLSAGRLRAAGGVREILERLDLQDETGHFEAGVALDGVLTGHDPAFRLSRVAIAGQHLDMPGIAVPPGTPVRLRVRARDVALATRKPSEISIRNILEGTLVEIVEEPDTAFAETLVDIGGQRLRARLTRAAVADLGLAPGMRVFALVKSVSFDRRALPAGSASQTRSSSEA